MATAYEHFAKAEELLHIASETGDVKLAADCQQAAQVHATLAHAAALGANERPGVPTPRSLDPRRNRQGYKTRKSTNDEGPAVSATEPRT
jgi:hypothetical protein